MSETLFFVLQLATCVAAEANPAANITWLKNNKPLVADGDGMSFFLLDGQNCPGIFLVWFSACFVFVLFCFLLCSIPA